MITQLFGITASQFLFMLLDSQFSHLLHAGTDLEELGVEGYMPGHPALMYPWKHHGL